MSRPKAYQVPTPCPESWFTMKPDERGRFCGQCSRTVIDFTCLTDEEVVRTMAQQTSKTCGRFRADQLNRPLHQKGPAPTGYRRLFGLVTVGLLGWQTTHAQVYTQETNAGKTDVWTVEGQAKNQALANSSPSAAPADSSKIITGQVVAESDGSYLSGVTIQIKGTSRGATTDSTGNFRVTVPVDMASAKIVLGVSSIGFTSQEISAKPGEQSPLFIRLKEDTAALNQVVVVGYAVIKPSFWQRLRNRLRSGR